jgi:MOB kinase activator 1
LNRNAVKLPKDQDRSEWLAINTIDFYNQINMLYGIVRDICTAQKCPLMSAGKKFEYLWADPTTGKPQPVSAPDYVTNLMEWIERQLDDPKVFPHTGQFPASFETKTIRTIFKRMFRVYAHIYHSHLAELESLNEHQHFNTMFKHFMLFVHEFQLVDEVEQKPLEQIISQLIPTSK